MGGWLRLGGKIAVFTQPIQHRLQALGGLEPAAQPHGIPAGELRKPLPFDGGEQILGVLVYGIGTHKGICGFGVFQKVSADGNGVLHGFSVDRVEHGVLGIFHDVQNAADTQDGTHELTRPVRDLCQVTFQPAFHLVEQGLQHFLGTIVQADWLLLVVAGKDVLCDFFQRNGFGGIIYRSTVYQKGIFRVSITVSFRFGTPSIAGNEKESYSSEPPKKTAKTKQN